MYPRWLPVAAVLTLTPVACDDPAMTEEEFCPAYARAECATLGSWCGVATVLEACESVRANACQQRRSARRAGQRAFSPRNAKACIDKVRTVHRTPVASAEGLRDLESTCGGVYQGIVDKGAGCHQSGDCRPGLICSDRRCHPRVLVKPTDSCNSFGAVCPDGYVCHNGACLSRAGPDMDCRTIPCQETLRCRDTAGVEAPGALTCVPRLGLMEPCNSDQDCALPSAFCDPYVGVCAAGLTFSPGSAPCQRFTLGIAGPDAGAGDQ